MRFRAWDSLFSLGQRGVLAGRAGIFGKKKERGRSIKPASRLVRKALSAADMSTSPFTVAIDGPAAAGKGTIARAIAAHFGFEHLDTGLLYRAVGVKAMQAGRGVIDGLFAAKLASELTPADLARPDLRSSLASSAASKVAAVPEVRSALFEFQRKFARRDGGAVLDGRDIGTVICPSAEIKFYVTASDAVRAKRRFEELVAKGADTSLERVAADLAARDARDAERDTAPMMAAKDAIALDTSNLSIAQSIDLAVARIAERM